MFPKAHVGNTTQLHTQTSHTTQMPVCWTIRDKMARLLSAQCEVERSALKSIIKDRSLTLPVRVKAQLELQKYPRYTRPTAIANRCIYSGKARVGIAWNLHGIEQMVASNVYPH
jgi:small subunit ribosomal protein S14